MEMTFFNKAMQAMHGFAVQFNKNRSVGILFYAKHILFQLISFCEFFIAHLMPVNAFVYQISNC